MRHTVPAILLAITLLFALTPHAAAQSFRQDIVVTAAAVPVELGTVTRTLTVITRDQIERLPVASVADVLRLSGSVDVRARGQRGMQTDFAIRGANFGQMLVLVDGVRLNDAQSGHHNGDIPVPLDAVERIEVLYGPGSSLFGADAFGGTINVITRRTVAPASGLIEAGSHGLVAARGQVGFALDGVRQMFGASVDRSSGFMFERGFASAGFSSRTSFGDQGASSPRTCGRILVPTDSTGMRRRTNGRIRHCLPQIVPLGAGRGGKSARRSRTGRTAIIFCSTFGDQGLRKTGTGPTRHSGVCVRRTASATAVLSRPVWRQAPTGYGRATWGITPRGGPVCLANGDTLSGQIRRSTRA